MRPIATPKYESIADELREQIIGGALAPGAKLPALSEMKAIHGISDRTAFQAMQILLGDGLVESKPGSGYYVRERPIARRMVRSWYRDSAGQGSPWRADAAAQGIDGSWTSQSKSVTAPPAIAERLRLEPGSRVMRTEYLFTADGAPAYLSTSWEPMALTAGTEILLPEDGEHAGKGVADRFATIGITVTEAREELVPRTLTIGEAQTLRLRPGTPVLLIERTYYAGQKPVETADIVLPPHYRPVYQIPVG